jgi:nucleoside-diphosphate-sugar epimerase
MEKLSIFGGTGFIGKTFASKYSEKCNVIPRDENVPVDDNIVYFISTTNNYNVFTDVHLDINTNLNKLMDVLPNVKGTINFISSWFVYGSGYDSINRQASETSSCNPKGFYSITKKTAEDLIISYCEVNSIDYRIIRLCNVIGGDANASSKKNAFEFLLRNIVNGEKVEIYTGDNYRNYLHVDDVVLAIDTIIKNGQLNTVYNVGSRCSDRLIDVIQYVKEKSNSNSEIKFVMAPRFHKIVQTTDFFMNCNRLFGLGFHQKYRTTEAIDRILKLHP